MPRIVAGPDWVCGCGATKHYGRGLCQNCYRRAVAKTMPPCTSCGERPQQSKGLCNRCRIAARRVTGPVKTTAPCACGQPVMASGLCARCLNRRTYFAGRRYREYPEVLLRIVRGAAAQLMRRNGVWVRMAGLEFDDLVQIGAAAFLEDAARKDGGPARARQRARGAMLDALRPAREPIAADVPVHRLDRPAADPRFVPRADLWRDRSRQGLAALPRRVRRAIGRLPPAQQQVLRFTVQGRGTREIAAMLGVTENTVALRKHHALSALRSRLAVVSSTDGTV